MRAQVLLSLLAVSYVVAAPTPSRAADYAYPPSCAPTDPKDCVQALLKGELAPFDGQLLTPRRAAKLGTEAAACKEAQSLEVARETALIKIDLDAEKARRAEDARFHQLEISLYQKSLDEARFVPWYRHPVFVSAVSVAATVAVFAGAVNTVRALK